jgi:rod shape-determining protein MreD
VKYAVAFVVAWLLAVLNVSAMPFIKVLGVTPDLVLIFAACWAVIRPDEEALIVVPVAGLLRDLLSSDPVGASMLAFIPIVVLAAIVKLQALDSDFLPVLAVVAIGSVAFGLIHTFVLAMTGQPIDVWYTLFRVIVPLAVVNPLFAPIVYLPVRWMTSRRATGLMGAGRLTSPL